MANLIYNSNANNQFIIANGAAISNAIEMPKGDQFTFLIPSAGWTDSNLTMEVSNLVSPTTADTDWFKWYMQATTSNGIATSVFSQAGVAVSFPPFHPHLRWLRLKTSLAQTAQRIIPWQLRIID